MARSDPVWVFVDASYRRESDGWRGSVPALGVSLTAKTREEVWEELQRAVARHLRPRLIAGELDAYLEDLGFYKSPESEWIPRITSEDERIYVRVTPIESLPMRQVDEFPGEPEEPA